ncbi:MAG TPA: flagellar brake protein [Rubrivivax sp.]|nr:flagellar brake protein [Burkholderiales bacterium]HNT37531.1 flagellar brake protein [Rubrivivax sp.]
MFEHTRPAALDDASRPEWAPFRVEHAREIGQLLGALRDSGTPMVLSAPDGSTAVCALWSIDSACQRINFTVDPACPSLQPLVDADEAQAVGYLDLIKLQFELGDLLLVRGARHCALQAALPRQVYRFQRRSAYRVRTLERHAPTARLRHPALPEMQLSLRVIDVSVGGCALLLPEDLLPLQPGTTLHDVQVALDAQTRFGARMQVQHASALSGDARQRLGCRWLDLTATAEQALQRYVDQTQKQRRQLALD